MAHEVLGRLEAAWNGGDGVAFGDVYAPDASFVTIRGEHIVGDAAIGAGHDGIFRTIYAGSVNRMELVRADEIAEGVILAVRSTRSTAPRVRSPAGARRCRRASSPDRDRATAGGTWCPPTTPW